VPPRVRRSASRRVALKCAQIRTRGFGLVTSRGVAVRLSPIYRSQSPVATALSTGVPLAVTVRLVTGTYAGGGCRADDFAWHAAAKNQIAEFEFAVCGLQVDSTHESWSRNRNLGACFWGQNTFAAACEGADVTVGAEPRCRVRVSWRLGNLRLCE